VGGAGISCLRFQAVKLWASAVEVGASKYAPEKSLHR
jgi:hypothetical protein